jgi:hypothetical protein
MAGINEACSAPGQPARVARQEFSPVIQLQTPVLMLEKISERDENKMGDRKRVKDVNLGREKEIP